VEQKGIACWLAKFCETVWYQSAAHFAIVTLEFTGRQIL